MSEELEIIIKANITNALAGIKKITSQVKQQVKNNSDSMKEVVNQTKDATTQINSKLKNVSDSGSIDKVKENVGEVKEKVQEASKNVDEYKLKLSSVRDTEFSSGHLKQLELVNLKIDSEINKLQELRDNFEDSLEWDISVAKAQANIEKLYNQKEKLEKICEEEAIEVEVHAHPEGFDEAKVEITNFKQWCDVTKQNLTGFFSDLKSVIGSKVKDGVTKAKQELDSLNKKGKTPFTEISKKASSLTSALKGKLASSIKSVASKLTSFGKTSDNAFSKGIKSIKKFTLSLLSVRSAFSLVSKAASSYLSFDTQLNDSITNCWNALGSLLAPVLEYVVSLFSKAVSYINAFVTSLTGIDLVARANAKAINSQATATKNLANTQTGLDEFHTISDNSSSSSDSGSTTSITVEDVDLESLKDKILNTDWYSVGMEIGKKINNALSKINWTGIQKMAISIATNVGDLVNGLVDGIDWSLVGNTIGNGIRTALLFAYTLLTTINFDNIGSSIATMLNNAINTALGGGLLGQTIGTALQSAIDVAYGFVTTFDWAKFGTTIAENVNSFFDNIDWEKLGTTVGQGISGIFSTLSNFVSTFDWTGTASDLATGINSLFDNINWDDAATTINEGVKGLADALLTFFFETDWSSIGESIGNFIADIDWLAVLDMIVVGIGGLVYSLISLVGGLLTPIADSIDDFVSNLIQGFCDGITAFFNDPLGWIQDNIVDPFINAIKNLFGIHSPSTVMEEIGGFLIAGIQNGLSGLASAVGGLFQSAWNKITSIFSLTNIKNVFNKVVSGIKNCFSSIGTWFKTTFTNAWNNVKNVFSSGGKIFSGIKDGIANTFKKIVNTLIAGINKIIATPFNAINSMLNKIRDTGIGNLKPFKDLWKKNPLSVPQIPSLATGDVADEEQIVRIAEYSNAKTNPEIVSPKNMMEEVVDSSIAKANANQKAQKQQIEITGKTKVSGSDLVIIYDKAKKDKGFDGNKNPSFSY